MGFFDIFKKKKKMSDGLEKTRTDFFQNIVNTLTSSVIDDDLYNDLEEQLILADVGPSCAVRLVDELRDEVEINGLHTGQEALDALRDIIRREVSPKTDLDLSGKPAVILVVGVNGVGKTTTKEFCYAVLSAFGNTLKTEGNQNNEIGLPNTLFRLEDTTQYAVVEMGMSHLGEIARLVRAARPSAGIITMIGVSHLENLGTRENILKAKMEICQGLPDGAPLVLNADDDLLPTAQIPGRLRPVWFGIRSSSADVRAINIHTVGEGTGFTLVDNVDGETYEFSVTIPTAGVHTVYDALAAYTAATRLGLERARAARALASYQTTGMRQNIVQHGGVTFIEDCYNASPDSMKAALQILHDRQPGPGGRRIAVLGDMLELGAASEPGHRQTGKWAADAADLLVAYGPLSAAMAEAARQKGLQTIHCQAAEEVVEYLRQNVRPGDVVLAKASHAMKLDDVLKQLYAALPNA